MQFVSNLLLSEIFQAAFLGIIAGILIDRIVKWWDKISQEGELKKNFKFEIKFNINKIEEFLKELENFKDSIASDTLVNYYGYIPLSKVINITSSQIIYSGFIYKYLEYRDIGKLQNFLADFSSSTEQFMNFQLMQKKGIAGDGSKQSLMGLYKFWKDKLQENKDFLELLEKKI